MAVLLAAANADISPPSFGMMGTWRFASEVRDSASLDLGCRSNSKSQHRKG